MSHLTRAELDAALDHLRASPRDVGTVKLIVCRPERDARKILDVATLSVDEGLLGDNWKARGSSDTPDGSAHPEMQLNVMNARMTALVAQSDDRWALAGDQLYVELDLSVDHLPAGTQLTLGTATIEITAEPHLGCKKFTERFGLDAMKFVNSPEGKLLRLRGVNAKVVTPGEVRTGDPIRKL